MQADHDAHDGMNPYTPPAVKSALKPDPARLDLPAQLAVVCCLISLGFSLVALAVSLPWGNPAAPPALQVVGFFVVFMALPALGLAGAIAMMRRDRYALSIAGAAAMMVPVLGPCFGLTLPLGIWTLLILRRTGVRDAFSLRPSAPRDDCELAEDALAEASRLDAAGHWDEAIAAYRTALGQWPQHAAYINNCITDIERKKAAAM